MGILYCGGSLGNAFLEVKTIFKPGKRHIIEERAKKGGETQESGDKPTPGPNGAKGSN